MGALVSWWDDAELRNVEAESPLAGSTIEGKKEEVYFGGEEGRLSERLLAESEEPEEREGVTMPRVSEGAGLWSRYGSIAVVQG